MTRATPHRHLVLIAACGATVSLAGCMGGPAEGVGPAPLNPLSRYSLQVAPGLDQIALAVHDEGLSANQGQALTALVNRFAAEGAPTLRIEAPSGDDVVSSNMAWAIKGQLEAIGVPGDRVQVLTYIAPDPRAPVLVGFDTVRAVVPQCGTSWTNLARTGSNAGSANFGCAVNANLAAQIADPRDILGPRAMTPSDAARRSVVLDNYRQGTLTAAPQEELIAKDRVSDAVE